MDMQPKNTSKLPSTEYKFYYSQVKINTNYHLENVPFCLMPFGEDRYVFYRETMEQEGVYILDQCGTIVAKYLDKDYHTLRVLVMNPTLLIIFSLNPLQIFNCKCKIKVTHWNIKDNSKAVFKYYTEEMLYDQTAKMQYQPSTLKNEKLFSLRNGYQIKFYSFPKSGVYAIVEKSLSFRISYSRITDSKPSFCSEQITYLQPGIQSFMFCRLNNQSMIGLFQKQINEAYQWQFVTFELKNSSIQLLRVEQKKYKLNIKQLGFSQYEDKPYTYPPPLGQRRKLLQLQDFQWVKQNTFVIRISNDNMPSKTYALQFSITQNMGNLLKFHELNIEKDMTIQLQFSNPNNLFFSSFIKKQKQQGQMLTSRSRLIFLDTDKFAKLWQQQGKVFKHKVIAYYPQENQNLRYEYRYTKEKQGNFINVLRSQIFFNYAFVTVFLLSQIVEECEEDLMMFVTAMLH